MPTYDLFSARNRPRAAALLYDELPASLRHSCIALFAECFGHWPQASLVDEVLVREHPTISFYPTRVDSIDALYGRRAPAFYVECLAKGNFAEAMDAVEMGAVFINKVIRDAPEEERAAYGGSTDPDEALAELNARFLRNDVGYQFSVEENRLVRVDSEFMHAEVTKPAMTLLTTPGFEGAAQEFAEAHQAYREAVSKPERGKDAVAWAVKAIESTAKSILEQRQWSYDKGDTIKKLLDKLFANGLVPAQLEAYFGGLRTALTSGLAPIGNSMARHGQGSKVKDIEQHMATLGMHLAAATICFLVEAHLAKD